MIGVRVEIPIWVGIVVRAERHARKGVEVGGVVSLPLYVMCKQVCTPRTRGSI